MKVSIAWIFDHINADLNTVDVPALIKKINEITAEVEGWRTITTDLSHLALGQFKDGSVIVPEWNISAKLSHRDDAYDGGWYLITKDGKKTRWATSIDLGATKEMLLPAIHDGKKLSDGKWKKSFETTDTIFTIDNKAITHRPDLWGHRGFAREVAAMLDLPLKPLDEFVAHKKIVPFEGTATTGPFSFKVETELCKRFAGLSISKIEHAPSLLWMVTRLSRVDSRSIDTIVDCTNYVMLDIGQPMHAFDADKLASKSIGVRIARNKEKLTLLDEQTIELTDHDIVITDGDRPISLAGIMGGKDSAVSSRTSALFLESANFDATAIRRSSFAHKVRSEASGRFEKSLDPNQNTIGIERFLKLIDDANIAYTAANDIASIGALAQSPKLTVSHQFIEDRLGCSLASSFVIDTLRKLGFQVREEKKDNKVMYHLVVPEFRAMKDIGIKEDIVEEVGRFYGWGTIKPVMPLMQTKPTDLHDIMQTRRIKRLLSYGLKMHELYMYSFFDEAFLRTLQWDPGETVQVKDPVSENWYRLVTTLIPHMLFAVQQNADEHDELRFYEWARCWHGSKYQEHEKKVLSGIMFSKRKHEIDFYRGKADLQTLFHMLRLSVTWQPAQSIDVPWYDVSQTAQIVANGKTIGMAGMVDGNYLKHLVEGAAFIFELDAEFLATYEKPVHQFVSLSKFPSIERDVSVLAPLSLTVDELQKVITNQSNNIKSVYLIDMFQKKEWKEQRALTFRYRIQDETKTMTKEEADSINHKVVKAVEQAGGEIR